MRDNEFSPVGLEFAPTAEEVSQPRAEFSVPGAEAQAPGGEFDQSAGQVRKEKKRGVSPLMLTAAAVTTAAVVLTGGSHTARYPTQPLSAEQGAYLEEVYQNLLDQNGERLAELSDDPMLEEIILEVMEPYAEMLNRRYGLDTMYNAENYFDIVYDPEEQVLCWVEDSEGARLDIYSNRCADEGVSGSGYVHTEFGVWPGHLFMDRNTDQEYWFSIGHDQEMQLKYWNMEAVKFDIVTAPNGERYGLVAEGRREYTGWHYFNDRPLPVKEITQGTGTYTWNGSEGYYETWLKDGTRIYYVRIDDVWQEAGAVEVRDGRVVMNDNLEVTQNDGYYWLTLRSDTVFIPEEYTSFAGSPFEEIVAGGNAESVEDFLNQRIYW